MTAHKHAAAMLQYAQDATETDKPWERWESNSRGVWNDCLHSPAWREGYQYRRKPEPPKTETRTYECWAHHDGYLHWIEKGRPMAWPEQWNRVPSEDKTVQVTL